MTEIVTCAKIILSDRKVNKKWRYIYLDGNEFDSVISSLGHGHDRYFFENMLKSRASDAF